jgi:hypothetical protein
VVQSLVRAGELCDREVSSRIFAGQREMVGPKITRTMDFLVLDLRQSSHLHHINIEASFVSPSSNDLLRHTSVLIVNFMCLPGGGRGEE